MLHPVLIEKGSQLRFKVILVARRCSRRPATGWRGRQERSLLGWGPMRVVRLYAEDECNRGAFGYVWWASYFRVRMSVELKEDRFKVGDDVFGAFHDFSKVARTLKEYISTQRVVWEGGLQQGTKRDKLMTARVLCSMDCTCSAADQCMYNSPGEFGSRFAALKSKCRVQVWALLCKMTAEARSSTWRL